MSRDKLGRGLEALLADVATTADETVAGHGGMEVDISNVKPNPNQPRQVFDSESISALAASIKQQGIIHPLLVKRAGDGSFLIISGERRWRAAQIAGLDKVPVFEREVSDHEIIILGLVENLQREDLNAFDEAEAIQNLQNEFALSQDEIGIAIGKSRAAVSNSVRLLNLAKPVQELLREGKIGEANARTLLGLPVEHQHNAAKKVIRSRLSVRQTEELVKKHDRKKKVRRMDADVERLEQELSDELGATVNITRRGKRGGGYLRIQYRNLEQLQAIIKRLRETK